MKTEDKAQKLEQIIKRTQVYSDLNVYPPFQTWKKNVVDKRVKTYLDNASKADLDQEEGQKYAIRQLIKYQELTTISEDIFRIFEQAETSARKKLKEIIKS